MEALLLNIHSQTPEIRKIKKVADELREGAVILYPSDTGFALGCRLSNKNAINRIRQLRNLTLKNQLTFLCQSLSNISEFAKVNDDAYKTIKALIPGPYTFILPASRNVPNFAQNPKRKTAGIRVPDSVLNQLILKELDAPMISISAKHNDEYINDPDEVIDIFKKRVDLVVSSDEYSFTGPSTVIDMTSGEFELIRAGAGYDNVSEFITITE